MLNVLLLVSDFIIGPTQKKSMFSSSLTGGRRGPRLEVCRPSLPPPADVYSSSATLDVAGLYKVKMRAERWIFLQKMPHMPVCQASVEGQQAL